MQLIVLPPFLVLIELLHHLKATTFIFISSHAWHCYTLVLICLLCISVYRIKIIFLNKQNSICPLISLVVVFHEIFFTY